MQCKQADPITTYVPVTTPQQGSTPRGGRLLGLPLHDLMKAVEEGRSAAAAAAAAAAWKRGADLTHQLPGGLAGEAAAEQVKAPSAVGRSCYSWPGLSIDTAVDSRSGAIAAVVLADTQASVCSSAALSRGLRSVRQQRGCTATQRVQLLQYCLSRSA
jgi:hypothetical protein